MKLTKFSQRNLDVITNFLLYAQMEDELTQTAIDYISEDHVDGEDSPEAILERALEAELIVEEAFMDDDELETFPYDIYADSEYDIENDVLIYAVSQTTDEVRLYKLIKPQSEIEVEHRKEILETRLSKITPDDFVTLGDIFMHGKYIERLS